MNETLSLTFKQMILMIPTPEELGHKTDKKEGPSDSAVSQQVADLHQFMKQVPSPDEGGGKIGYVDSSYFDRLDGTIKKPR